MLELDDTSHGTFVAGNLLGNVHHDTWMFENWAPMTMFIDPPMISKVWEQTELIGELCARNEFISEICERNACISELIERTDFVAQLNENTRVLSEIHERNALLVGPTIPTTMFDLPGMLSVHVDAVIPRESIGIPTSAARNPEVSKLRSRAAARPRIKLSAKCGECDQDLHFRGDSPSASRSVILVSPCPHCIANLAKHVGMLSNLSPSMECLAPVPMNDNGEER